MNRPKKRRLPRRALQDQQEPGTLKFLQQELEFTDAQIEQYDQIRKQHHQRVTALQKDIHRYKRELMEEVFTQQPDTLRAMKIAALISEKQEQIERITFLRFLDLKALCGKEQSEKLHRLIDESLRKHPLPQTRRPVSPHGAQPKNHN
ncbi:periplasmic heavy metal sensor [candidate division KSB1 bacterium]|nr:periplasmic heavy metal sensor [candidate division KSB1 bacterium]